MLKKKLLHKWMLLLAVALLPGLKAVAQPPSGDKGQGHDSVAARVIAIGGNALDAGKATFRAIVRAAAQKVLPGKTTLLFLGDNVSPTGMGASDDQQQSAMAILKEAYTPFTEAGVPVYFMAGEKDWDNGGPNGLKNILRSGSYLNTLNDSLLHQYPADGCPDPKLIPVNEDLAIIMMDTEWWLHGFEKNTIGADCSCVNEKDITNVLRELLYQNRYKTVILATHHPFLDYGFYNGHYTWKDHLFPLTHLQKDLYIPLPGIGSLYPLLGRAFQSPQQLHHPLYKQMRQMVGGVFKDFPNLIYLSAHEPGLQVIRDTARQLFQVISGGADKRDPAGATGGKYSLFHSNTPGFVLLDVLSKGNMVVRMETIADNPSSTYQPSTQSFSFSFQPSAYRQQEQQVLGEMTGDSIIRAAHPSYADVSGVHQFLFGKNYRKAWALPVKLPVLRVSSLHGGLSPVKLGGGFQSTSLRMEDTTGKEYSLRSVEKSADLITPEPFQGTFVKEWLDDATSGQHPYSALVVPPLAEAVGVFHSNPVIGVVAPDSMLGQYGPLFEGKVTLLEEREPAGETDNTFKTVDELQDDNDNRFNSRSFLKARGLDYLLGDWDRHEDQWRFQEKAKKGKPKYYQPVPRDRDMVFNVTQGLFPGIIRKLVLMPRVFGYSVKNPLRGSNYYFYKSDFLDAHPNAQLNYATWHQIALEEQAALTDEVLEQALRRMPEKILALNHSFLLSALKQRRDHLAEAMDKYYTLSNKYVDIHASDKNELIEIKDRPGENGLEIRMRKISKKGNIQDTLMHKFYPRNDTREIRLYLGKGEDSVYIDNHSSTVKLRLVGGKGHKSYHIKEARKPIHVYDYDHERYTGADRGKLHISVSRDSAHTAFQKTNRYNTMLPLLTGSYNADDKLSLGLGTRIILQNGFRKSPYTSAHQIMVGHSFATKAYNIRYSGQWKSLIGGADLITDIDVKAPNNTQNYFGRGNQTVLEKFEGYQRYYRTRFTTVDLSAALRWDFERGGSLQLGPGYQYYHMDAHENDGRFIENTSLVGSYDSSTLFRDKMHLGIKGLYEVDHRNKSVLPQWGMYARVQLVAYKGLNDLSRTFAQLLPELVVYKPIDNRHNLILSDRIGGGVSVGHTTFYQSLFLGGEGNLLGYRKYRFAGQQSVYNNLSLRWALMDFGNYIIKGELGLSGFFDIGRVWQEGDTSQKWHNGYGGGIYFAPAGLTVINFVMGRSAEGWYPYISMGFRF